MTVKERLSAALFGDEPDRIPLTMLIASPIEDHTRELVAQAGSGRGFAISITEDASEQPLWICLEAIERVLSE